MRFILYCLVSLTLVSISFTHPQGKSTGAPASSTGAPNEFTCNTIGCHDDAQTNLGNAQLYLDCKDFQNGLVPGKSYTITSLIYRKNTQRFGFQLVALDEDGNQAGKFELLDKQRTQILHNDQTMKDRQYVTYTYPGTKAFSEDLGQWTVQWIAPKVITGKVSFYLAGVAANNDGSDKGDEVYTFQKQVLPGSQSNLIAFPNPFINSLQVQLPFTQNGVNIRIWNKEGNLVSFTEVPQALGQTQAIEGLYHLSAGVYFLEVNSNQFRSFQKIIKE